MMITVNKRSRSLGVVAAVVVDCVQEQASPSFLRKEPAANFLLPSTRHFSP